MYDSRVLRDVKIWPEAVVVEAPSPRHRGPGGSLEEQGSEPAVDPEELLAEARKLANAIVAAAKREAEKIADESRQRLSEAASKVTQAEEQARQIIDEAQVQAEQIHQQAHDAGSAEGVKAGHQQGYQEGFEQITAELQSKIDTITSIATSAKTDERRLLKGVEKEVVSLAISIAERVIRREMTTDPTIITEMVEAAAHQIAASGPARILVNPADWEIVSEYWEATHANDSIGPLFEVVIDERVEAGGCIIETATGRIDAQISTQVESIREGLLGR